MPAGAGLSAGTHRKPASSTRRSAATRMSAGARAVASTWLRVTVREGLGEMGYAFRRRREADALVWRSSWATSAEPIHKFWLILVRSRRLQFQGMHAPLNCSLQPSRIRPARDDSLPGVATFFLIPLLMHTPHPRNRSPTLGQAAMTSPASAGTSSTGKSCCKPASLMLSETPTRTTRGDWRRRSFGAARLPAAPRRWIRHRQTPPVV